MRSGGSELRVSVLTLNIWALPIPLPREDRRARMERLPEALRRADADIVMLQEALHPRDRDKLIRALTGDGYETSATGTRRLGGLVRVDATGGLVTLSRFPVVSSAFHPLPVPRGAKCSERLGRKGALRCVVRTPLGPLTCVNVHLYAGVRPADRAARLAQLRALPLDGAPGELATLLAGDLNASPPDPEAGSDADAPEVAWLARQGFRDAAAEAAAPGSPGATYAVSDNPYAAMWADPARGDLRLDFVMVRPASTMSATVREARVVLNDQAALVSDHYGVQVEFALSTASRRSNP